MSACCDKFVARFQQTCSNLRVFGYAKGCVSTYRIPDSSRWLDNWVDTACDTRIPEGLATCFDIFDCSLQDQASHILNNIDQKTAMEVVNI